MSKASKRYKQKEWLENELNSGRTLKSIADEFDVCTKTISYWRDKFELDGDKKTKLTCSNCSKKFKRLNFHEAKVRFCSKKCESKYKKKDKIKFSCANCGDEIRRIKSQANSDYYCCSVECRNQYQTAENHPRYSTVEIECDYCSKSFERTPSEMAKHKNYCSEECYHASVKTDRDENKHEHKIWRNNVRERDEWQCQNCGYVGDRIEAHHIDSWQENPQKRFELDNGISLCIECHYLTHKERGEHHSAGLIKGRADMDRVDELKERGVTGV